ncbi:MAG: alkane 1-monooxygenase [Rheinheimera sp.]|uniref:alkane 1-monooxygenase n=1 Tax=Arsukibacterium sp. UBA3155 TaxID=1946058 RepID=UPI000C8C37E7|nr:alkane 1-monooxygenase [Arsukibacterium sp. UBA3155]MAD73594.1 alkane 1-monooxygenase [Rheinheimera sp.]|tara:strand:- start:138252 stop:139358 length:1107 start_codon:yes stop_codon:yes gene_type:complete
MFHYLKFSLFHLLTLPFILGITLGGNWMALGLLVILLLVVGGDLLFGSDATEPDYAHPWLLNSLVYSSLLFILLIFFALLWSVAAGDLFGYGQLIQQLTGYDALAARNASHWWHFVPVWLGAGLLIAMVGTVPAHELTHRTADPLAMLTGRWLLAFSFDCSFAIEHVYGHHRYVGTRQDPATAPRGRNVYQHILHSTVYGNCSAWRIETQRLTRQNKPVFSFYNRFLRGIAMSVLLGIFAFSLAGWLGLLLFTGSALFAKAVLEVVNYIEHYGIERTVSQPVRPYHSWNSTKRISSWASFNLTRHSHHHARAQLPFYQLKAFAEAPDLPTGYLGSMLLALLPPLWFRLMTPKLQQWDLQYRPNTPAKQ